MNQLIRKAQKAFLDTVKIKVQGGSGGHGLPQFGGVGGKGGDVYIVGSNSARKLSSLLNNPNYKHGIYKAGDGKPALRTRLVGESGRDLMLKVPLGVTVSDIDGSVLGEVNESNDQVIIALGGRGGDKFNDNHGFYGQKRAVKLDLKTISDAVFVGFPNAGKSSLLRAVSNAQPRVANYPFTTLRPYLGVVEYQDYRRITMADLPGLVEGAHKNLGLGHDFLKHITRSRLLVFVIDVNGVDLGPNYNVRSAVETLCVLNKEIELYDDTLLQKPAILAISKVDSFDKNGEEMARYSKIKEDIDKLYNSKLPGINEEIMPSKLIEFDDILPLSSEKSLGIGRLKQVARAVLDKYEEITRSEKDKISSYQELRSLEYNRII